MIGLGRLNRTLKAWSTRGRFTHAFVTSRPSADGLVPRPGIINWLGRRYQAPAGIGQADGMAGDDALTLPVSIGLAAGAVRLLRPA
jgi:hypothetical protein